jgi:hypothetical protein
MIGEELADGRLARISEVEVIGPFGYWLDIRPVTGRWNMCRRLRNGCGVKQIGAAQRYQLTLLDLECEQCHFVPKRIDGGPLRWLREGPA